MSKCMKYAVPVLVALMLTACANNPNKRAMAGTGIGAVLGALAGQAISHHTGGTAIGGAVGAVAGAAVGHYLDVQQHELNQKLAKQKAQKELRISRLGQDALLVGISGDASFGVDSSAIKPQFQSTYRKIASVLKEYPKSVIHVVGFTDSTGSANYNLGLSKRRAESVSSLLNANGVKGSRLLTEGRGETQPVATNSTRAGRAKNRRVEIVIKPIVEGQENEAYQPPPPLGHSG